MTTSEGDTESDGGADRVRILMLQGKTSTVAPRWPNVRPFFHPLVTSFQSKRSTRNDARVDAEARHFLRQCVEKDKMPRTVFARFVF